MNNGTIDADGASQNELIVSVEGGKVEVPVTSTLFTGDYLIDGQDLVISPPDGVDVRVVDYFTYAFAPELVAPNGAVVRGVDARRLAGAAEDTRLAQAQILDGQQSASAEQSLENAIGQVEAISGTVNVVRADGATVTLGDGDLVFQNDVIETGPGSSVSLTFVDGTIFSLSASSRMVIDELIFDPGGSDNSAVFSLIVGGFVFIAGAIAPTGGMDVQTPTGNIGIRGTTVEVQILTQNGISEVLIGLLLDPDGGTGQFEITDNDGNLIAIVNNTETTWVLSPIDGETREIPRAVVDQPIDPVLLAQAIAAFRTANARVDTGDTYVNQERLSGGGNPTDRPDQDTPDGGDAPQQNDQGGGGFIDDTGEDGGAVPQQNAPENLPPPDTLDDGDASPEGSVPPDEDSESDEQPIEEGNLQLQQDGPIGSPSDQQQAAVQSLPAQNVGDVAASQETAALPDSSVESASGLEQTAAANGLNGGQNESQVGLQPIELSQNGSIGTGQLNPLNLTVNQDAEGVDSVTLDDGGVIQLGQTGGTLSGNDSGATLQPPAAGQTEQATSGPEQSRPTFAFADTQGSNGGATGLDDLSGVQSEQQLGSDPELGDVSTSGLLSGQSASTTLQTSTPQSPAPTALTTSTEPRLSTSQQVFQGTDSVSPSPPTTPPIENEAPVAQAGSVVFFADQTGRSGALSATDPDGDALTFAIVQAPQNGEVFLDPASGVFQYTADPDFIGTDSFSYTATDEDGTVSNPATVTVNYFATNTPPTVSGDSASTTEETPVTIDVLTNDIDPEGDTLTVDSFDAVSAQGGTVSSNGDGTFDYTPAAGFSGTDSFTYSVSDGAGGTSVPAQVTISVGPVNDPPVAVADAYSVDEDATLTVAGPAGVLSNDIDPEGDVLSAVLVQDVANGTLTLNGDGSFSYTPDANYNGPDSFTYRADDGQGGQSAEITVQLTVNPVNDAPVAGDDAGAGFATSEDTPFTTASVLTNDIDPEGDTLTVDSFDAVSAQGGTVSSNGDGTFDYTPAAGFSGTDSFTYSVSDGAGGTSVPAQVTISVGPVNDPPVAVADAYSVDEDATLTVAGPAGVLSNDIDPEGDVLSAVLVQDVANGTLTLNGDGSFSYTPDANYNGPDSFTYRADDGQGGQSAEITVQLTVNPVNDAPVAGDDAGAGFATSEDTPFTTASVLTNDIDPEGDTLTVDSFDAVSAQGGTVSSNGDGTFDYTPAAGFSGTDSFTYSVSDGAGGTSVPAQVTISVGPVNDPPVAVADAYSVDEDATLTVAGPAGVLSNDIDPEGDVLSAVLVQDVANGTLTLNGDGSFSYTPDANYNGPDSFTYRADDGQGGQSAEITVQLTVNPVNDAPVAGDDAGAGFATSEDTPFTTASVLTNDIDPEGDTLTVDSFDAVSAQGGTVSSNGDGTFDYTPAAGFSGTDSFTYSVSDGAGGTSVPAQVTISVGPVNDPPVAVADAYSVDEDATLTVAGPAGVLSNDIDPEGDVLSAVLVQDVANGTLTLNGDGSFSYTPDANYNGPDSFTYRADDGQGGQSAEITVQLTVNPVNDAPVAGDDAGAGFATSEDTPFTTASVLTNDIDPEGDTLTVDSFDAVSAQGGTVSSNGDGTFDYTPAAGFSGTDSFTYSVSDGAGGTSVPAQVTISVGPVNDPPVAVADAYSVDEDATLTVAGPAGVLSNDIDPEGDVLSAVLVQDVANGTLTLNGDGSFSYTPDANYNGPDSFTYRADDGQGGQSAEITVQLTVNPVNDAPVAGDDAGAGFATSEDTPFTTASVLTNDIDPEGDTLTVDSFDAVSAQGGTVSSNGDGTFDYTPAAGFSGTDSFTYSVSDGAGGTSVPAQVTISVGPVNDPPVAVADAYSVDEDATLTVAGPAGVLSNDIDPEGDVLSAVLVQDVANGTLTLNGDGSFSYTPDANYNGPDSFTYRADDGQGGQSAEITVQLTVNPVNDAPVAGDDAGAGFATSEDTPFTTASVLTNDIDPEGDTLTVDSFDAVSAQGGTVSSNGDGTFDYTPAAGFSGTDSFTYSVSDGAGGTSVPAQVTISVGPVNDPPVAVADAYSVDEDATLTVAGPAGVLSNDIDPEGDVLSAVLVQDVANGTLTLNGDGSFSYTPDANYNGPDSFTYRADDGQGGQSAEITVQLTVNPVNDAPVAGDDAGAGFATSEDTPFTTASVLTNDIDPEGDTLTVDSFDAVSAQGGTVSSNGDGTFDYTPAAGFSGTDSFTYSVSDGAGGTSVPAQVTISVGPVNDPPVAVADAYSVDEDATLTVAGPAGVLSNDIDPEGDVLSAVLVQDVANGTLTLNGDGSFSYTPDANYNGPDSFTYRADDGQGGQSAEITVQLTVNPVNDAPVAGDDAGAGFATSEDTPFTTASVLTNDIDPEGDTLTVDSFDAVSAQGGTVSSNGDGTFDYTPAAGFSGTDSFTYSVSDGAGGTSVPAQVTISVGPVNDPPVAVADAYSVDEDATLTVAGPAGVLSNDIDPEGDVLSAVLVQDVANGTLTLNGDGSFSYTPDANYNGPDSFTYRADDGQGGQSAEITVQLTVNPVNDAPVAGDDAGAGFATSEDTPFTTASVLTNDIDPEGDTLTVDSFDAVSAQGGTVSSNGDGTFDYTPAAGFSGTDSFTYSVSDGAGGTSVPAQVTISVGPVNDPPVAVADAYSVDEDATLTVAGPAGVLSNDIDPEGDVLSAVLVQDVANGTLTLNGDGSFSYTPDANYNGPDSFTYRADDGQGGQSAEITVQLTVNPVNDAPVAGDDAGAGFATSEDTPFTTASVLTNDIDPEGDTLTVDSFDAVSAQGGTVSSNGDGTFDYTPAAGFSGTDSFTYSVSDGAGGTSVPAQVTISVGPVNDPPVAVADAYSVDEDATLTVAGPAGVLSNDIDPEGDVLSAVLVQDVANGTLTLNGDGSFSYTPDANYNGPDSFTYRADDGQGGQSAEITVQLTVNPVNDAVSLDVISDDDLLDVVDQTNPVVISGTAEANGSVRVVFGTQEQTVVSGTDGRFSAVFSADTIPDAPSVDVLIEATDAQGNLGGTATRTVSIEQPDNLLTVTSVGAVSNFESPIAPVELDIGSMPYEAIFQGADGSLTARVPTLSSNMEVRFAADSGRTFSLIGTNLDYDAGSGIVTGYQIGTPTDPDFYSVSGLRIALSEVREIFDASLINGSVNEAPLDTLFAQYRVEFIGSEGADQLSFEEFGSFGNVFVGNGGNDELRGGAGDDQYFGGDGIDLMQDWQGSNQFDGGTGAFDIVSYAGTTEVSVIVDLNATVDQAIKSDGTRDQITNVDQIRGTNLGDSITLLENNSQSVGLAQSLGGNDTVIGGVSSFDYIDYSRESRFTALTTGVIVNLTLGLATDLFGDTDELTSIEGVIGTEFGDIITGASSGTTFLLGEAGDDRLVSGDSSDTFELGSGSDTVVFTAGEDSVNDFNASEDFLQFDGDALTFIDSVQLVDQSSGADQSVGFRFTDGAGGFFGISVANLTIEQAEQILADLGFGGGDILVDNNLNNFTGTPSDDNFIIQPGIVVPLNGSNDRFFEASAGDDRYDFTQNTFTNYNQINYNTLVSGPILADIDLNAENSFVDKGSAGTDTLVNVQASANWGFGLTGTPGNDTFNVTFPTSEFSFFAIGGAGGQDTINMTGGSSGLLSIRADLGPDINAVLDNGTGTGVITSADGATYTVNYFGDVSQNRLELRTGDGNDSVVGTAFRDRFILGGGTDTLDGGDGEDIIRYDRFQVTGGVTVNLQEQTATGSWNGELFEHTLISIEGVRGSALDDSITASDDPQNGDIIGNAGNDTVVSGAGDDYFELGAGSDLLIFTTGRDYVDDLDSTVDRLEFSGAALANIGTLSLFDFDPGDDGTFIEFNINQTEYFGLAVGFNSFLQIYDALIPFYETFPGITISETSGGGDALGTPGDDNITLLGRVSSTETLKASYGDDIYRFSANSLDNYHEIDHRSLGEIDVVANLTTATGAISTIQKGPDNLAGVDTFVDLQAAAQGGVQFFGTRGNDQFNVTLNDESGGFIGFINDGGQDTVNVFGADETLALELGFNSAVTGDLVAGTLTAADGSSFQILTSGNVAAMTYQIQTGSGNDSIDGSNNNDRFILRAGNDTVDGRAGLDTIRYDWSGFTTGVNVNLSTAFAVVSGIYEGQAFTHELRNFEGVRGSQQDDTITGSDRDGDFRGYQGNDLITTGTGSDFVELGSGSDTLVFVGGVAGSEDFVEDFDIAEDVLELQGAALDLVATLNIVDDSFGDQVRTNFDFRDASGELVRIRFKDLTVEQGLALASGFGVAGQNVDIDGSQSVYRGTIADDTFNWVTGVVNSRPDVVASVGNDTYRFTNLDANDFTNPLLFYDGLGTNGIVVDFVAGREANTVGKGTLGTDTLIGIDARGELNIFGTRGDDEFNIVFDPVQFTFADLGFSGGKDTLNATGGNATLKLSPSFGNVGANVNLLTNEITSVNGDRIELNLNGDLSQTTIQVRTSRGDDSIIGSDRGDEFAPDSGFDTIDGGLGFDRMVYSIGSRVGPGLVVDFEAGVATGTWSGTAFTHFISSVESASGSIHGDLMIAANSGSGFDGRNGNDTLTGGTGNDTLIGGAGDDLLAGNAGDDILYYDFDAGSSLDGGSDRDTLFFQNSGSFDFTGVDVSLSYEGLEVLSLENGANDTLRLNLTNVIDFSDTADRLLDALLGDGTENSIARNSITVRGETGDVLQLSSVNGAVFTSLGQIQDEDGTNLTAYEYTDNSGALAIVAVDDDVSIQAVA